MFFLVGLCLISVSMGVVVLFAKYFKYKKERVIGLSVEAQHSPRNGSVL